MPLLREPTLESLEMFKVCMFQTQNKASDVTARWERTGLPLGPSSPGGPFGPGGPAEPAGPDSPFSPRSPLGP